MQHREDVFGCFFTVLLMCLTFQVFEVKAECSKPTGGDTTVLEDKYNTQDSFPDGSKVFFECIPGYLREKGNPSVTCLAGNWTQLTLTCQKISCGSPPDFSNGRYNISAGIEFGAIITAICDPGYKIVGSNQRHCEVKGWSGRTPVCEAVKCGEPPTIKNGQISTPIEEEYNYGTSVSYTCDRGFTLVGVTSIICSESGLFQPEPPNCLDVTCPTPEIDNAIRSEGGSPPYKPNHSVRYQCNEGYTLEGEASLKCLINGSWSAAYPTCQALQTIPTNPTTIKPINATNTASTVKSTTKGIKPDDTGSNGTVFSASVEKILVSLLLTIGLCLFN